MKGLVHHLLLTLRLNFRSPMPVIYGYLVPVFFLIGFAAVFNSAKPPVVHELGQLLTITILGGACFGMPTAMVAERERGIWRRYRLLPAATGALVFSTMIARLALVASSALLQILLAVLIYKMPMPEHLAQMAVAFLFVTWAFLGMGLVIAMLAQTVPAVQALGQAIFLPMILIGGVGVPLTALPAWARVVAGYLPGRYAVEALNAAITGAGIWQARFSLLALTVIGAAAIMAGANMFRWDAGQRIGRGKRRWILFALAAWGAVGGMAQATGRSAHGPDAAVIDENHPAYESITDTDINSITYDDLQDDGSFVTPIVASVDDLSPDIQKWTADFRAKLNAWPPGNVPDPLERTRNLLNLAAVADLAQFQYEGEVARVVFDKLLLPPTSLNQPSDRLTQEKISAYIILHPLDGGVLRAVPEFGIPEKQEESGVRTRTTQYAKKLLGRLLGKLG